MNTQNRILRTFRTDDSNLLQFADVIYHTVSQYLTEFTAFDGNIDALFMDNYLAQINAAMHFGTDNQKMYVMAQNTSDVNDKMRECRDAFQFAKYFIEQAFPKNKGAWNDFGYSNYKTARTNHNAMIQFMLDLHISCQKHETKLNNAGFDNARIANISTLANGLQALNISQGQSKGNRSHATSSRVLLLNTVWETCRRLCQAGKTMNSNNYGKHQLYLIPWSGQGSKKKKKTTEYSSTIKSQETQTIDIPKLKPNTLLTIENTGTVPLLFCSAMEKNQPCTAGLQINAGDSQAITFASLFSPGNTDKYLIVSNLTDADDGSFKIES